MKLGSILLKELRISRRVKEKNKKRLSKITIEIKRHTPSFGLKTKGGISQ